MIEPVIAVVFGGGILWLTILQRRKRLRRWEEAAVSCGLRVVEAPGGLSPKLRARAGLVTVAIDTYGDKGRYTRIVVQAPAPPEFHSVKIHPESVFKFGREAEIGDRQFDETFFLGGPARLVFALLDADTRRLLTELKEKSQFSIASGELRAILSREEKIAEVLRLLLDVGKRLSPPVGLVQRLVANANEDPDPGVRLQNLLLLIRELSWSPETDGALRRACSDPVPEIRLRAAKQLGDRAVLLDLAEKLEDDAASAEALAILADELTFERVSSILDLALRRRRLRAAHACLGMIGRQGEVAVEKLAKVLEREYGELAPAAAEALGATGSPAAEPPLLQALEREDEALRVAAADALGRVGSTAAVLPLKELADQFLLGELRRAARQAIVEIQSRVQGASPGQLSLAEGEAGQLSLADQAGQLSLPPEERPA